MRRRLLRIVLGASLAIAWAAGAGAYLEQALACAAMANDEGRAACCAAAKQTRFNGPLGDCCRDLRWIDGDEAQTRAADPPPVATYALLPASTIAIVLAAPPRLVGPARDAPERPPPLTAQLATTVLLI